MKPYALTIFSIAAALTVTGCVTTSAGDKTPDAVLVAGDPPAYEKLVYGAQKPLVCTEAIEAKGDLKDRPNLSHGQRRQWRSILLQGHRIRALPAQYIRPA